ncbi:MAG: hypothetical protein AAGC55_15210 [Myxococcota bacterium]
MKKFALIILAGASVAILGLATPQQASASGDCARTAFKTEFIKAACAKGGQSEANKAMKKFMSKAKKVDKSIKNCKSCHSGLKKDGYPLTKDGLKKFNAVYPKVKADLK